MKTEVQTIQEIFFMVAKELNISIKDIKSSSRGIEDVVFARQVAHATAFAYSSAHRKRWTLDKIGKEIGRRHHSSVIHSVKTITLYIEQKYRIKEIMDTFSLLYLETNDLIYQ